MSDLDPLAELRPEFNSTENPQLLKLRDFALAGSAQPKPQLIRSFPLTEELLSIQPGESLVIKGSATVETIFKASNEGELLIALVIRDRSLTENNFQLLLEVGTENSFPATISAETVSAAPISFFDHISPEHGHHADRIQASEAPYGHFFIEATNMIRKAADDQRAQVALRISVLADDEQGLQAKPLQLGRISLDIIER